MKIIKYFNENTKTWDGKPMVKVTCLGSDNRSYDAEISEEEANIYRFIKYGGGSVLSARQKEELIKLMEDYGQRKYEDGYDEAEHNAQENS